MIASQLDTSVLIGTIIVLIFGIICTAISVGIGIFNESWLAGIASEIVTVVLTGAFMFLVWFPFGYAYNHYVPVSGTVTQVNSRFIASGNGGSTQYWAIWFGNMPYKCDDTRCGGLHAGSKVTLLCEKEFQFNAPQQGYICNWGKLGLNN